MLDYIITYNIYNPVIYITIDTIVFILSVALILKKDFYKAIPEIIVITLLFNLYQIISLSYKNIFDSAISRNLTFYEFELLQIDYYLLIFLTILHEFKKGEYIYGRWWKRFLVVFTKRRCSEKSVSKNQENVQTISKIENEIGYKLFIVILSIFQITVVGTACYFINKVIIEYFIISISFFILRPIFGKSYHSDSVLKCTTLSMLIFVSATRLSLPLYVSVLLNIFIGALVSYSVHVMYYFIKYTTNECVTITRGMNKDKLLELCYLHNLTEDEISVMTLFYCDKLKLWQIANKLGYSDANISKIKEKALKKLK